MQKIAAPNHMLIVLDDVRSCEVVNISTKAKAGMDALIEKLELRLTLKTGSITSLPFYNVDIDKELSGELQLVQKWANLIRPKMGRMVRGKAA